MHSLVLRVTCEGSFDYVMAGIMYSPRKSTLDGPRRCASLRHLCHRSFHASFSTL